MPVAPCYFKVYDAVIREGVSRSWKKLGEDGFAIKTLGATSSASGTPLLRKSETLRQGACSISRRGHEERSSPKV